MRSLRPLPLLCLIGLAPLLAAAGCDMSDGDPMAGDRNTAISCETGCDDGDPCTSDLCADDTCTFTPAQNITGCANQILDLRVEKLTASAARVLFETTQPASCEVIYGLSADSLDQLALDPSMDLDNPYSNEHDVPLEDLVPATTYFFRARAEEADGTVTISELRQLTTLAAQGGEDSQNIALGSFGAAISAVSSNFGGGANDSSFGADNAIDGSMSTEWSSDGDGDDAFIAVDLGAPAALVGVALRSRQMTNGTAIITQVELLLDGGPSQGGTRLGPFEMPDPSVRYMFKFDAPQTARLVQVNALVTTGGNTGLKAFELLAPMAK